MSKKLYDLVMKAIVLQPSIAKIPLDENQVDTIFASKDKALGKSEKYRDREIKIIRLEVYVLFTLPVIFLGW